MQEENLNFSISLTGTYWDHKPQFSVWLDDHVIMQSEIASQAEQIVNFERKINEGPHFLKIRLENKTTSDTVIENGEVVKDMLLNIDSIEIDGIEIETLKWSQSKFFPDNPARPILDNCVNLGWNGTYKLNMTSPFYLWLLENM